MRFRTVVVACCFVVAPVFGVIACVGDDPPLEARVGQEASVDGGGVPDAPATTSDASCADTSSDPLNCGACGTTCNGGKCFEGVCGGEKVTALAVQEGAAGWFRA
jgi:hypothetical protein